MGFRWGRPRTSIGGVKCAGFDRVSALAERQHGAVSGSQLDGLGFSRFQQRMMVDRGWLRPEAPRVYVVAGSPATLQRRQYAGLLCLGPSAVLSHETAARLHGFDRTRPDVVEFTMPRSARGREVPFTVHTTRVLPRIDRVQLAGFPCTSATRTIIDLARARVPRVRVEAAIDSAVRTGASSPIALLDRMARLRGPGRWGVRLLDELLVDSGGHTLLERKFLKLMREAGLPRPTPQVVFRRDGTYARVDFYFEEWNLVVEVSGRRGHSSPSERAKDAQRRNELQDSGRAVYEYTWEHVTGRPGLVISSMRTRLGQRSGA